MHNNKKTEHTPFVRIVRRPTISQGNIIVLIDDAAVRPEPERARRELVVEHRPLAGVRLVALRGGKPA